MMQLISEGEPLTDGVTTHKLMMTTAMKEMYAFLDAWQPFPWDDTLVVADLPEPVAGLPASVRQFYWADVARHPAAAIFSRGDSACRSQNWRRPSGRVPAFRHKRCGRTERLCVPRLQAPNWSR